MTWLILIRKALPVLNPRPQSCTRSLINLSQLPQQQLRLTPSSGSKSILMEQTCTERELTLLL
jgi:hypothetical protein